MKIHSADYIKSAPSLKECPDFPGIPEFVLVGRSNVGKSSFINSLLLRKNLARTSNTPGKTRHINFYRVAYQRDKSGDPQPLIFVDLPGYGFAKVSKAEQAAWRRNLEAYLSQREAIRLVILLIDARHGPKESDIQMLEWLQAHGRQVLVILTKTDKLSRNEVAKQMEQTVKALQFKPENVIAYSAETHQGRDAVWQRLDAARSAPLQPAETI